MSERPLIVLYDGDCRFCRASITRARRWARPPGLRCLPFDDPRAVAMLSALPPGERHAAFHVVDGRRLYSATAAFGLLLRRLPGGGVACALGAHRLYPWIVRHRTRLGRLLHDAPRPPEQPHRSAGRAPGG